MEGGGGCRRRRARVIWEWYVKGKHLMKKKKRIRAAFPEDMRLVLSTHLRLLTTFCNSNSRVSSGLGKHPHTYGIQTHEFTQAKIKLYFKEETFE